MLSIKECISVALREADGFVDAVSGLSEADWRKPTRCEGWDALGLVRHTAAVMWQQAEALHRVRVGTVHQPSYLEVPEDPAVLRSALAAARESVGDAASRLTDGDPLVPLPFSVLPASIAMPILVIEYGFHRNDLLWALGNETDLPQDVSAVHLELAGGMLPLIAAGKPDAPTAYTLRFDTGSLSVTSDGGDWQVVLEAPAGACEIAGSDSEIALFTMGRIPASAVKSSDAAVAARFKEHFPGP